MNLYLLQQYVNNNYDTFDECVVCAENEDEARMIHPEPEYFIFNESLDMWVDKDLGDCFYNTWCHPKDVKVKLIGTAHPSIKKCVISASFNAG